MLERFQCFLNQPLEPSAGRAIVACASALFLGLGVLVVLGAVDVAERPAGEAQAPTAASAPAAAIPPPPVEIPEQIAVPVPPHRRQDPQDVPGSAAARRVAGVLRERRALQHVPYRSGKLTVDLVGARDGEAVLRVIGPSIDAARQGWRAFLRRYRDAGTSYRPVFVQGGRASMTEVALLACPAAGSAAHQAAGPAVAAGAQRGPIAHHKAASASSISPTSPPHIEVSP